MYIIQYKLELNDPNLKPPPESDELMKLRRSYSKSGKLLDRIVTEVNQSVFEVVLIFDSYESYSEFREEPLIQQRLSEMDKFGRIIWSPGESI